jgi:hypothetical protein
VACRAAWDCPELPGKPDEPKPSCQLINQAIRDYITRGTLWHEPVLDIDPTFTRMAIGSQGIKVMAHQPDGD